MTKRGETLAELRYVPRDQSKIHYLKAELVQLQT